jgi:hypothetical protein
MLSTEQSRWLETPYIPIYLVVTTESLAIHGGEEVRTLFIAIV